MDKNSIVVAYDYKRGEGRGKFRKNEDRSEVGKGDCIDCKQCINVCPTGIDIRNGTQMECINCTLCMDACDHMMENVGIQKGLIRYDSEEGIKTKTPWKLTRRAKAYIALMIAISGLLAALLFSRSEIEATVLRVKGTTYQKLDEDTYTNIFKGSFMNKTSEERDITMKIISGNATIQVIGGDFSLEKGELVKRELLVTMDHKDLIGSKTPFTIGVFSGGKLIEEETVDFAGPGF
jgi:cytochrome c oxidase accessory protein FixG